MHRWQVRRMLKAVGFRTERLCRVSIGNIRLGELASGEVMELPRSQVQGLYAIACTRADASLQAMPTYDDDAERWIRADQVASRSPGGWQ